MHDSIETRARFVLALGWLLVGSGVMVSCQNPVQPSLPLDSPFNHPCAAASGQVSVPASRSASARGAAYLPSDALPTTLTSYAGKWTGQYHITGCARVCGLGPDVCKEELGNGGAVYAFDTTLVQSDAAVDGRLDFYDNTGDVIIENGHVTGVIDASGTLILSGTTVTTDPAEPRQTTLAGWNTTLTGDGMSMIGRFTRNQNFTNAWGPQQFKIDCELVNVRRSTQ
jgi:hypothetical protein